MLNLSLSFQLETGPVVWSGCSRRPLFNTRPSSCSYFSHNLFLVLPSSDPSPIPSAGVAKGPSNSSSMKLQHSCTMVCCFSHSLASSLPVLHPDWINGAHLSATFLYILFRYALSLARFHKFPLTKQKGLREFPEMRVFTSEHSHFSVKVATRVYM